MPALNPKSGRNPAEVYEELFVPALFAQWGDRVADAAQLAPRQHVLDVGCGTGVLTRAAAARVGGGGRVAGLDASPDMLAVASRNGGGAIEWHLGRAEAMPFADRSFDAVVSQFALMLFADPRAALREMARVARPGGTLAVCVLDALERVPGYHALTDLLGTLFGDIIADAMRPPFALGDPATLRALFDAAGLPQATLTTQVGRVRFSSVEAMVSTERACVWTLGSLLDDDQYKRLRREAERALQPFVDGAGGVSFDCPAHIVTASLRSA